MAGLVEAALDAHRTAEAERNARREAAEKARREREAEEQAQAMALVDGAFRHHYDDDVALEGLRYVKHNSNRGHITDVVVALTDLDVEADLRTTIRLIVKVADEPQIAVATFRAGPMPGYGKRLHSLAELGEHIQDVRDQARHRAVEQEA